MATKAKTTKATPKSDAVESKDEGEMSQVLSILEGMDKRMTALENGPTEKPTKSPEKVATEQQTFSGYLPPRYTALFEEFFDTEDGFSASLDGMEFTISVPDKFSNRTDAHKQMWKNDFRTKMLQNHDIEGGITDWCKKVATNLGYKKQIVTK